MPRPLLQLLLLALTSALALAQDPTVPTVQELEAKASAAAELAELDAAAKEKVDAAYKAALEFARTAATSQANAAAAAAAEQNAPTLLVTAKEGLAAPLPAAPSEAELARLDLPGLEERLRDARATSQKAAADLTAKEDERQRRTARLIELPGLIASARDEVAKVQGSPLEGAAEDPAALREARADRRAVRMQALRARIAELEAEKRRYEAEAELLTVQRDDLARRAGRTQQALEAVDKAVQARRLADAKAAAEAAEQQVQTVSKVLEPLARRNQELTAAREQWLQRLTRARTDRDEAKNLRTEIESRSKDIDRRITTVGGMTEAIGVQLRKLMAELPSVRKYLANIAARPSEFDAANLELIELDEERQDFLAEREDLVRAALEREGDTFSPAVRARIEEEGRALLAKRQEYLDGLLNDLNAYLRALQDLDTEERLLVQGCQSFTDFVNEHVLWIRSTRPVWRTDWRAVGESSAWFLAAGSWQAGWGALLRAAQESWVRFALLSLLALALIVMGRPARRRIAALAAEAANSRATSFRPTAWATLMTLVAAAGWPLLLWHLATLVVDAPDVGEHEVAVASGLAHMAILFGVIETIRQAMRPNGLAEAHLRWPTVRTRLFRRNLTWFALVALPLAFVLRAFSVHADPRWSFMLDRLLLIVILIVIAVFQARVLHPDKGVLAGPEAPGGVWRNTRLWFVVGVGVPFALAIVAATGYHLSALELLYRLEQSLGVLGVAVLVHGLGMRWMLLAKRRLAMAQARARREALKAKGDEATPDIATDAPQLPEETMSIASVDAQSRKLLGGGLLLAVALALWGIWVDVLPALRALEEYAVWGEGTDEAVSLANVLMALVALVITFVAARNIPGLLELLVLQRLRIHAGERHAATTLVRYLIVTVGIVLTFSSIGIGWDKVQWLVAAVSVGLGFGLQEIFANFVSGLIILFERQIRIGDLVTVGEVDGYVTRIRMRATTIMDFDRKEMIVPNKEFVTGSMINWTLTDPVTRVVISVGVAYGSDTELARKLLLQAAADNELVLDEPAPTAIFRRFGDSTLDFDLRVFIATRDYWPQVTDSLHSAVDGAFRQAGIEIAFPQRDLHVRTLGPLEQLIAKKPEAGAD